ncbi:MAG: hypothetical protein JST52_04130 [Bacteroidetes bacterium]|nr:hypothetical protein [Bacteroidota bacterium]MBS1739784.1 hypothetical protein [Bacteroidota bacterium]
MNLINEIIFAIGGMLALVLGIILFIVFYQRRMLFHQLELKHFNEQKQKELLQAAIAAEENERMRIAGELHDDVGATLSSIRLFLHSAAKTGDVETINQSRDLLDDSIKKIRAISHRLQPTVLQHLGLENSLCSMAETLTKSGQIKMDCTIEFLPILEQNEALSIYRILQELINNIIKHSHATYILLESLNHKQALALDVTHNGYGLTNETYQELIHKRGAIGLKNIVNRLQVIQGTINFEKRKDNLYKIHIAMPIKQEKHEHYQISNL